VRTRREAQLVFVKWLVVGVVAVIALVIAAGQLGLLRGAAPTDLGVHDGRLKPPSPTPNSVSSQAALYPDHPQREYANIAPLPVTGDGAATLARIRAILQRMPGAKLIRSEPGYLYAQFTTPVMKFVDDVEFWFDPARDVIDVRSASRVGRSDLGVNRRRIEAVRAALAKGG
jgi:uncharacterized protein (DUF1499 family)